MKLGQPINKTTDQRIRIVLIGLVLAFLVAFIPQIRDVFLLMLRFVLEFFLRFPHKEVGGDALHSLNVVMFNLVVGFGMVFVLWLFLSAGQTLLPVSNLTEVYRAAWHLWLFIFGRHGPAILVKDGEQVVTQGDATKWGHGVIVVDFNSAVVLEERDASPGLSRISLRFELIILNMLNLCDPPTSPRACGPGIVFTLPGERIRGIVDLRKQFRLKSQVSCYTREGIELNGNVISVFTAGMSPDSDALQVTFVGEHRPENARVCQLTPVAGRGGRFFTLTGLQDELDEADRAEIFAVANTQVSAAELVPYTPLPRAEPLPAFDPDRVFAAVFAQARDRKLDIISWTELPTSVASGIYRELLPTLNYDELYDVRENGHFPLPGHKTKMRLAMRDNGLLAYRLIYHHTGEQLVVGRAYHESELIVSDIRPLTNSKILRDRGIMMIASSFGDLIPVSPLVYKQRLDSWRAEWERELNITHAGRELQAMRTRSRALAEAQQNLWRHLDHLFHQANCSDEALAISVMQALEQAATDPQTRALLPGNTIDLMRHIHTMLQPPPPPPPPPSLTYLP